MGYPGLGFRALSIYMYIDIYTHTLKTHWCFSDVGVEGVEFRWEPICLFGGPKAPLYWIAG